MHRPLDMLPFIGFGQLGGLTSAMAVCLLGLSSSHCQFRAPPGAAQRPTFSARARRSASRYLLSENLRLAQAQPFRTIHMLASFPPAQHRPTLRLMPGSSSWQATPPPEMKDTSSSVAPPSAFLCLPFLHAFWGSGVLIPASRMGVPSTSRVSPSTTRISVGSLWLYW